MLDNIRPKETKSCDPAAAKQTFGHPTNAGSMKYLAFIMIGLIKVFYSVLFVGETP